MRKRRFKNRKKYINAWVRSKKSKWGFVRRWFKRKNLTDRYDVY